MEEYSLDWCDRYLDEKLDKMGSDLFPLPVKLNRFRTIAYDFIRETVSYIESNQEISDDIKPLLVYKRIDILQDPSELNTFDAPEPVDYLRLISLVPLYLDKVTNFYSKKSKITSIIKVGQRQSYNRDPFRTPTHEYPSIFRFSNIFKIDVGATNINYTKADIAYVKEPTIASIENLNDRIINLPDTSIEKILNKTADSLRLSSGDTSVAASYQFHETFGKKNK